MLKRLRQHKLNTYDLDIAERGWRTWVGAFASTGIEEGADAFLPWWGRAMAIACLSVVWVPIFARMFRNKGESGTASGISEIRYVNGEDR